jgi:hypothetical protein
MGFLNSLLPVVGGAALDALSGGALTPIEAGLITGGLGYAATGNLGKGVMAGLGGYGGYGLGQGLLDAGAGGIASALPGAGTDMASSALPDTSAAGISNNVMNTLGSPASAGSIMGSSPTTSMNAATGMLDPATNSVAATAPINTASSMAANTASNAANQSFMQNLQQMGAGAQNIANPLGFAKDNLRYIGAAGIPLLAASNQSQIPGQNPGMIRPWTFNQTANPNFGQPGQAYFNQSWTAGTPYSAANGGQVPQSNSSGLGAVLAQNTMYPQSQQNVPRYNYSGEQTVASMADGGIASAYANLQPVDPQTQEYYNQMGSNTQQQMAQMYGAMGAPQGYAHGGNLGGYSDGGQLLKGPGDGVSDSIPASIEGRRPARLATGEFVVPARIVSELGNGSTDAGAQRLYAMMAKVQQARRKTMGKDKFAEDTNAAKYLPA